MTAAYASAPVAGFADPVFDAQATFRALLNAMARPGTMARIAVDLTPPAPWSAAAAAVALTLFDHDTPVWLDNHAASQEALAFLAFHCGCPHLQEPSHAAFALVREPAAMPSLDRFSCGTDTYPDSSTTVVIELPSLDGGAVINLTGPGIAERAAIAPLGLPDGFWDWMILNRSVFPLGVDVVLTSSDSAICLPRTTKAEVNPCT